MRGAHVLTGAQFDGLAAGYGDADALAVLRAGQLTKRKLLLWAVAEQTAGTRGSSAAAIDVGLDLLAQVEDRRPDVAECILGHPNLDAWAVSCLRRLQEEGNGSEPPIVEFGYVCALAAAAAVRAGLEFEIVVPSRDGGVLLPTLGLAHGIGDANEAVVAGGPVGITISGAARTIMIAVPVLEEASPFWSPVRTLAVGGSGDRLHIQVDDLDPLRDSYGRQPTPRLTAAAARRLEDLLGEAWELISVQHPVHAQAIRTTLRSLVPLVCSEPTRTISATSRHAFGSIGTSVTADGTALALALLHEFQHMKLGGVLDLVDLHRSGGAARYHAPWRDDPRPVGALLQGVYAHLGVTDFWRVQRQLARGKQAALANFEFAYWREQTVQAVGTLASSGELTGLGVRFVGQLAATLSAWQREAVSREPGGYARDLVLESTVRWRLGHFQASSSECARVADAWLRGAPCPATKPIPASMKTAPGPAPSRARSGHLAELVRRSLTQPGQVRRAINGSQTLKETGRVDPATARLTHLTGEHSAAIACYRRQVEQRPGCDEGWAGLALALARSGDPAAGLAAGTLAARPELVRAVYCMVRSTGHRHVTPDDLAKWLAGGIS